MRRSNTKKSSRVLPSCLLIAVIILCLGTIAAMGVAIGIPLIAEDTFGASSPQIDPVQRVILSTQLLLQRDALTKPNDELSISKSFEVQLGESTYDITNRLQAGGFISNAELMRNYLVYKGLDTTIQAGEYSLNPRMSSIEIAGILQDATPTEVVFRILPGWRLEEIAAILPTSGLSISPDEFLESVRNPTLAICSELEIPQNVSLEGYLFPDSYRLPREIMMDTFIRTLLDNFEVKVSLEMREAYEKQGLTLHQAVILASIVQREAIIEEEMPTIASVFLNRLSTGMKLDSDPTVQYALGYDTIKTTWWKTPLSLDDLAISSPYNTYLQAGFPPGAISNPGLNALKAIAFPSQTSYFYFRAMCDGSGGHNFSQTFEEHQQKACP